MRKHRSVVFQILLGFISGSTLLTAQVRRELQVTLGNWPAPLYWQPSTAEAESRLRPEIRDSAPRAANPANSLVFIAMTPCRVVDTRASQGFPAFFGPPSLIANATRTFPIQSSASCSIPSIAQAYSFNVTVIPPGTLGFLSIWPTGQSQPNAVTLDDITGDIRNNAAIVPAGSSGGSVDVHVNGITDLVIDINGYYAPSSGITLGQGTASVSPHSALPVTRERASSLPARLP